MHREERKKWISIFMLVVAIVLIPLVHFVAPLFVSGDPIYVSANDSTSIMGKTNVYAQLLPYAIAYLSAPLLLVIAVIRLIKQNRK